MGDLTSGVSADRLWSAELEPRTAAHIRRRIPVAVRAALAEDRGPFPVGARRLGALWGENYDLDVAGTLRNGAAVYGLCVLEGVATVADADRLTAQMRATRYGFGREGRIRAVFALEGASVALTRRAARDHLLVLDDLASLF